MGPLNLPFLNTKLFTITNTRYNIFKKSTHPPLPPPGPHAAPQLVLRSEQRKLVRTEGYDSDWPLLSVSGWPSGGGVQIDRRVLVPPLLLPAGRAHAVRAPGPNQFGEGVCQSQQSGGGGRLQRRDRHQDGNAGGRLKQSADVLIGRMEKDQRCVNMQADFIGM